MAEDTFQKKQYKAGPGWLDAAVKALVNDAVRVVAPVKRPDGAAEFATVTAPEQIAAEYANTRLPLKALFLPRTERLLKYKKKTDGDTEVLATAAKPEETVVIGSRPCDAAALALIDAVFNWDYEDAPYRGRRDATTIVSFACPEVRQGCFCDAVGGGPRDERGSDVLVCPAGDGGTRLTALTAKGEAFVQRAAASAQPEQAPEGNGKAGAQRIDLARIKEWLDANFESDLWQEVSLACRGCGACSYLCPTCHCFDIVDEGAWNYGERRRNWDCCAFKLFTLHASGHNPRPNQTARWRQRVMHKFKYFPDRFGAVACVGCGRCASRCTAGQNLQDILLRIQEQPIQENV